MKLRRTKPAKGATSAPKESGVAKPKQDKDGPNPPRTTTGWITSPKFGSAGSGGAELEPGIDKD